MISHLQYADDTIVVCSGNEENIKVIKKLLRIFELLSGLIVNFDRSFLFGVKINSTVVRDKAVEFGYEVGTRSINYIGVKVDINHRNSEVWNSMIQRI